MPSTRKQKAKEKRSRQSDVMSDVEILDVMLGTYSRNEMDSQLSDNDENMDQRSNERLTNTNPNGDDFRTLFNTNSVFFSLKLVFLNKYPQKKIRNFAKF